MARVYTHKARKDYERFGIKKGDTYYEWTLRPGGRGRGMTYKSLTRPKRAQMTNSSFLGTIYSVFDDDLPGVTDAEGLRDAAQAIRDAGEECQSSLDNMPESLQSGPTGEMLQCRIDSCESTADDMDERADTLEEALEDITRREEEWGDYTRLLAEWFTSAPEGFEGDEAPEVEEECPEGVDEEAWTSWMAERPVEPDEEEGDWDALRAEAISEALDGIEEPDAG